MSFSYDHCLEKWQRAATDSDARIRILELHPKCDADANADMLQGTLAWSPLSQVTSLPRSGTDHERSLNPSSYKALSYTWGNGTLTHSITINGASLKITRSLFDALSHLQPTSHPLRIWIDQICINQQDFKEKEEQVSLMDHIYRNSEETLVWLGPAADGSDNLLDFFATVGAFAETHNMLVYWTKARRAEFLAILSRADPNDAMTKKYHDFCKRTAQFFNRNIFDALIALYKRPWFSRTWVVQEFSLPTRVTLLCGHKTIAAETLMMALQIFESTIFPLVFSTTLADQYIMTRWHAIMELNALSPFFSSRQRRKALDEGRIKGDTLFRILYRLYVENDVTATQPCDMIYGVLGLVVDAKRLGITIDYSAGDPSRQADLTFTKVARAIIASGKVDLLTLAQHPGSNNEAEDGHPPRAAALPSWVPDWRAKLHRSFSWLSDEYRSPLFNASLDQPVKIPTPNDTTNTNKEHHLPLTGYLIDTLEALSPTPWSGGNPLSLQNSTTTYEIPHAEYISLLSQIVHFVHLSVEKNAPIYASPTRRAEAAWRVPVGDLDQDAGSQIVRAGTHAGICKARWGECVREMGEHVKSDGMVVRARLRAGTAAVGDEEVEVSRKREAELERLLQEVSGDAGAGAAGAGLTISLTDASMNLNCSGSGSTSGGGSIYRIYMRQMGGKRPFLSRMGYVGMGPACAEPGDKIVVLCGASVPFVIRPLGDGRYRFLGECYCDGIMDGETVREGRSVEESVVLV